MRRGEYEDERWQAARRKAQDSFLARADNSWALLKPELFTVSVSRPKFDLGICRFLWGWGISPVEAAFQCAEIHQGSFPDRRPSIPLT